MEAMTGFGPLDQYEITAVPGEYDGHPPIAVFRLDYVPRRLSADRLALAVFLLFRPWISGELAVSEPMAPQLAEAIRDYSGFASVQVRPVEFQAMPIINGRKSAKAMLVDLEQPQVGSDAPEDSSIRLTLLRADQAAGSLRTARSATLVSNGFMLGDGPEREAEIATAICCLVAEDFDLGELYVPRASRDAELARLVRNVGIILT